MHINKSYDITDKYNYIYRRIIKMKLIDVKSGTYIDFGVEKNDMDLKFKVDDHVRI